jgi:colicin import membrane protein
MHVTRLRTAIFALPFIFVSSTGPAAEEELSKLQKIAVDDAKKEEVVVRLTGSKTPDFTSFTMRDPFRVVVDWAGSVIAGVPAEKPLSSGLVRKISSKQFESESEHLSRVTIELARETEFKFETEGKQVVIRFRNVELPPPPPEPAPQPVVAANKVEEIPEGPLTEPTELPKPPPPPVAKPAPKPEPVAVVAKVEPPKPAPQVIEAPKPAPQIAEAPKPAPQIAEAPKPAPQIAPAPPPAPPAPIAKAAPLPPPQIAAKPAPAPVPVAAALAPAKKSDVKDVLLRTASSHDPQPMMEVPPKVPQKSEPASKRLAAWKPEQRAAQPRASAPELPAAPKKNDPIMLAQAVPQQKQRDAKMILAQAEGTPAPAPEAKAAADDFDPGPRVMTYIGFKQKAAGSEVFVRCDGKARYRAEKVGDRLVLELYDTKVNVKNNERPLDTSFFKTSVTKVQAVPAGKNTRVEIDLRESAPYEVKRFGSTISVEFADRK